MKKAYIILAHKNPEQVSRLINALDDGYSTFFLHIDKTSYSDQWQQLSVQKGEIVYIEPVATAWGGFGLVQATLNGMRTVMSHNRHFDFISLLSGQHYPVRSNKYISDYLRNSQYRTFLEYTTIPDHKRWKIRGGLYRIDRYFLGLRAHERYSAKALNFLSGTLGLLKRKFPTTMKPYAGSQWFTTDSYSLQYILDFVRNNPDYSAFHKHTFAPDELFFHNILLNADDEKVRAGITNTNLLYMSWPDTNVGHPEVLLSADRDNILSSDALFARKFDMQNDARILDLIDESRRSERLMEKQGV